MIYSASAPKSNQQGNGWSQTGKGERQARMQFQGKFQTAWSCGEFWSASYTLQFVLNCGKEVAGLSYSCIVSHWLRAAAVRVGLETDKLLGTFKESQVLAIRKEKEQVLGRDVQKWLKGSQQVWGKPQQCTYSLSELLFCFYETQNLRRGERKIFIWNCKGWKTFSMKGQVVMFEALWTTGFLFQLVNRIIIVQKQP